MKQNKARFGNDFSHDSFPFNVRVIPREFREWHLNIGDVVEHQCDMEDNVAALYAAEECDTVTVHLNTDGGAIHAGDAFLHAMQQCKAPIHVVATGRVCSLGTFILLEAASYEMSEFCTVLCHSASYGAGGKMLDTLQQAQFTYAQCDKMLRRYYKHFLSEEEINKIVNEKYEHYMDADEFKARYETRNKALSAQDVNGGTNPPDENHLNAFKDEIFSVIEDTLEQEHESGAHQTIAVYDAVIKVLGLPQDELFEDTENE